MTGKNGTDGASVKTDRLVSYMVGEVWPRYIKEFGAARLDVYRIVTRITNFFLLPKEAPESEGQWFLGFFSELPDHTVWLLNELRKESDKLLGFDIKEQSEGKSDVGALKFLLLIGIDKWSQYPLFSKNGAMEEAAQKILKEEGTSLTRKFEHVGKQIRKREDAHKRDLENLAKNQIPRQKSIADTYPLIGKNFPKEAKLIDDLARVKAAQGSVLALRELLQDFSDTSPSLAPGTGSDDVKPE